MTSSNTVRMPELRIRFSNALRPTLICIVLIWMPLAVLPQIDMLRFYLSWSEIADSLSLIAILLTFACVFFACIITGVSALLVKVHFRAASGVAWSLLILPVGWLVGWQLAYAGRRWAEVVSGVRPTVGPWPRLALTVFVLAALALLLWRWRSGRYSIFFTRLEQSIRGLSGPTVMFVAVSALWLVTHPPTVRWPNYSKAVNAAVAKANSTHSKQNIFLITIDTLSEADANLCGSGNVTMPNLRKLAMQSTCFTRLYASSNFTTPTTSTIETGVLPWTHWASQIGARLRHDLPATSLAPSLNSSGYATHSINANLLASPRHHGTWRYYTTEEIPPSLWWRSNLMVAMTVFADSAIPIMGNAMFSVVSAADLSVRSTENPYDPARVYDSATALLTSQALGAQPGFFWLHTLPPHAPYLPPKSTRHRLLAAGRLERWGDFLTENAPYPPNQQALVDEHRLRYKESIMGADEALGQFLQFLERTGQLDEALVIVSSDHGESFERGFLGHGGSLLHEPLIRVPLLIKLPRQTSPAVVDMPVSQADLMPTILDLAGAKLLAPVEGRSLAPLLRGSTIDLMPVFAMSLERASRFERIHKGHIALIDGALKFVLDIETGEAQLYDLKADPGERTDLSRRRPVDAERMKSVVQKRLLAADSLRAQIR